MTMLTDSESLSMNRNSQSLYLRTKEKPRQHPRATVDILECLRCGYVYATLSCNVRHRKCPNCQGGSR